MYSANEIYEYITGSDRPAQPERMYWLLIVDSVDALDVVTEIGISTTVCLLCRNLSGAVTRGMCYAEQGMRYWFLVKYGSGINIAWRVGRARVEAV